MSSTYQGADASSPARMAAVVAPSDAGIIPVTRALYIGSSGDLVVRMAGSPPTQITFKAVAAGIFPVQVDMVYSTGTLAANIVALY